jgi:hypothetical protein
VTSQPPQLPGEVWRRLGELFHGAGEHSCIASCRAGLPRYLVADPQSRQRLRDACRGDGPLTWRDAGLVRDEDLEYEHDPRVYGQALIAAVLAEAARRYPGVPVETTIDIDEGTWRDDSLYDVPEDVLINAAVDQTPLPWSGIAPKDYPPGQSIADIERAGGRLPHLRLDQAADRREETGQ